MKFDPTEALHRMPDLGNNTEGIDESELEEKKENAIIKSFLKPEASSIDQEFEGELETPTDETGMGNGDSWNYYMNLAMGDGMRKNKELFQSLQEESKNKIALDLGCGGTQKDAIEMAKKLGCAAYLGVDKFNVSGSYRKSGDPDKKMYYRKMHNVTKNWGMENELSAATIRDEMLDGLQLVKDNSAVLLFNGIEDELFTFMPAQKRKDYFSGVAEELRRVVGKDGYIVSSEPFMLTHWGGLKLVRDEDFHKACNPSSLIGQPELYRIAE